MAALPDLICYVINLDRSPDRLETARQQLDRTGLAWERISAIDGKNLGPPPWPDVDHRAYRANMGRELSPNEVACNLSHIRALKQFLASDKQFCVILEDDFALSLEEFTGVLAALVRERQHWDVVRLAGQRNCVPVRQVALHGDYWLAAPLLKYTVGVGYLVNRKGATEVVRCAIPVNINFSHRLDHPWAYDGVKYRVVWPQVVRQNQAYASTVKHGSRKFMPLFRIPALIYRLRVGLMRLLFNMRHSFFLFPR